MIKAAFALGAGLVFAAALTTIPAAAEDASPAGVPTATPAAASVAQVSPGPVVRRARHRSTWGVTISPLVSMGLSSDELVNYPGNWSFGKNGTAVPAVAPGTPTGNGVFFDGNAFWRIADNWELFYKRVTHADQEGARIRGGKPSYAGWAYDLESQEGISYSNFLPNAAFDLFYRERHRVCCPGAGDPTNSAPRFYTGLAAGFTQNAGPRTIVGRPFRFYVETTYVNHHLDQAVTVPKGQVDNGKKFIYKFVFRAQAPVFGQKQVVPFYEVQNFEDYFNNNFAPSHTNRAEYGLHFAGTRMFSYDAYVKNDHQYDPLGDVPHKVNLFLVAHIKFGD